MADNFPLPVPKFCMCVLGLFSQHCVTVPVDMALVCCIVELVSRQATVTNGATTGSNITAVHIVSTHFYTFANTAPEWHSGPQVT